MIVAYLDRVLALPLTQRDVVLPLVLWQLSLEHPQVLDELSRPLVDAFLRDVRPHDDGGERRLSEKLLACGVTAELLAELRISVNVAPLRDTSFEARRPPGANEIAGGPMARFQLRSVASCADGAQTRATRA